MADGNLNQNVVTANAVPDGSAPTQRDPCCKGMDCPTYDLSQPLAEAKAQAAPVLGVQSIDSFREKRVPPH